MKKAQNPTWSLTTKDIQGQLSHELDAVRGFEKNIRTAIGIIENSGPDANFEGLAKGIQYNQQLKRIYMERAMAVLTLVGFESGDIEDGDDLERMVRAFD